MVPTVVFVIVLLVIYLVKQTRKPPNFPPGPRWLPFVGCLPELKKLSKSLGYPHLALEKLAQRYETNVLGLKLGNERIVTVFSYPLVRKVLIGEEYQGRPDNFFIRLRCMGKRRGLTMTDGEAWALRRNFVVRNLKNLGFGKTSMETIIRNEISEILLDLKTKSDVHEIGKLLAPALLNVLWTWTAGVRLSKESYQLDELLSLFVERSKAFDVSGGILAQHPWLRFIAPKWSGYTLIKEINEKLKKMILPIIQHHYDTWEEGRNDDLIYGYISKMRKDQSIFFSEDDLVIICLDMFIAGAEITNNTLAFLFLEMILRPEIQRKVQDEIDQQLSKDELLEYSHRHKLPYAEAVLLETERYHHVTPTSGPRRVLKDTVLDGYLIPKDTTVLIGLHSIHHDKHYWKDPENFRPERFLDENGSLLCPDKLIPFGLGKRRCLGDTLAKNFMFFLFVEILRKYSVRSLPGSKLSSNKATSGITMAPEPYTAQFIERM